MSKILVGLSGGVDSAVVAAILKQQGHEVFGYTLKLLEMLDEDGEGCCSFKDIRDARMICDQMGIEFLVTNWKKQFKQNVIDKYVSGIHQGRTYNPCVTCNSTIKIPVLVAVANHFNCDYVATGHYARVINGRIAKAKNEKKDQSYFLWETPTNLVSRLMFPLGEFESKSDTRDLARSLGLHVANKPDSTDLCFFEGKTKQEFLTNQGILNQAGSFVDSDNNVVGTHNGYMNYVPGQRAAIAGSERPKYVLRVLPDSNNVMVGDRQATYTTKLCLDNARIDYTGLATDLCAVVRYHSSPVPVKAIRGSEVELAEPVFGIAPGQSCVFYHNDQVVGGGTMI